MAKKAKVRVGTASWTDPTLVKSGRFYPPGTSTAEARLRFYASQFPIVEVDSSYYFIPRQEQAGLWVDRTPPDFVFNVKAFSLLTGHPTRRKAIPEDLEDEIDPKHRDAQRVYADHLSSDAVDELWHRFHEALLPLESAGKLGAVLMQYPEWFTPKHVNREALRSLRERLPGYQVCIEFRNRTWLDEDGDRERTLDFLAAEGLPLVCLDMPQGFRSSMPPLAEVTAPELAVVRFHGRDREAWQHKGPTATPRFRYLYNQRELGEWVPKIEHLAEGARNVHVLLNNCYEDHAVVNARQLTDLLSAEAPSLVVRQD
jgi:uncharacterized protein YecE (DUF72 family)